MPEWLKGADCKSAGVSLRWFESNSLHHFCFGRVVEVRAGVAQLARALAFQAKGRGFESRFPLHERSRCSAKSPGGSGVEHVLGKDEVTGSIPVLGSSLTSFLNLLC